MRDWKAVQRSQSLRIELTPPERRLWHRLNRRQIDGVKFRRQAAIGPYIADFLSHEAKIVIELDGETHADPRQISRDEEKRRVLEMKGFRVIRFFNSEVREDVDDVVRRIRLACGLSEYPKG
jgi:very-short-patch-repair endonuclease